MQAFWGSADSDGHNLMFSCSQQHRHRPASLKSWIAHMRWIPVESFNFHWNCAFCFFFQFFVVHKQWVTCCWGRPQFLPCGLSPDIYYLCNCVELVRWFCIHICRCRLTAVISVQIQFTDMESKMFKEDQLEHKEEDSLKTSWDALINAAMQITEDSHQWYSDLLITNAPTLLKDGMTLQIYANPTKFKFGLHLDKWSLSLKMSKFNTIQMIHAAFKCKLRS